MMNPIFAFKFNLRSYSMVHDDGPVLGLLNDMNQKFIDLLDGPPVKDGEGRGLHSSTFRLNVSAFCGIGLH